MARHALVEALVNSDELPTVAVGGCLQFIDEVAPDLLAVVESAANGTLDRPADERLLFVALHILGGGRVQRLHEPLMRLLRRPRNELDDLIGDATTETLGQIIAGAFNGNADDLFELLFEPALDDFVRSSIFGAVAFLTWAGRIDETATRAFLERFDQLRPMPPGNYAWFAWSMVTENLGWDDMAPRVERAYSDGRIPPRRSVTLRTFAKAWREQNAPLPMMTGASSSRAKVTSTMWLRSCSDSHGAKSTTRSRWSRSMIRHPRNH